jgi:hypothetical protein
MNGARTALELSLAGVCPPEDTPITPYWGKEFSPVSNTYWAQDAPCESSERLSLQRLRTGVMSALAFPARSSTSFGLGGGSLAAEITGLDSLPESRRLRAEYLIGATPFGLLRASASGSNQGGALRKRRVADHQGKSTAPANHLGSVFSADCSGTDAYRSRVRQARAH